MIWNEAKECMSRDELRNLQSARLVKLVDRVYHNVEFYRKKMQELGIEPGDIKGIEDITKLPFTTKADLRDNYPFGLFAVPQSQIVRVHASSGTTGKATVVGYTRKDISIWSECVARAFAQAGFRAAGITGLNHKLEDYYHTRRDTYDNMNLQGLADCYAVSMKVLEMFDEGAKQ